MTSEAAETSTRPRPDWLSLLEWLTGAGVVLAVVFLSAVSARYAGGFWRDEANSVQMATWPGFRANWDAVWLDAHPVGYSLVLKPLLALAGGQPAAWLRWAGMGIYLLAVGTLWLLCRQYSGRVPLLFFAAIVLNPLAVRFLSNLRPYGLVTWLLLLALFAAMTYARRGGRWPLAVIGLTVFLCVQCLYASTIPALCIVLGMTWVTWRNLGRQAAIRLVAVGLLAAGTVAIYLPGLIKARYWADLQSYRTPQLAPFWGAFTDLLKSGGRPLTEFHFTYQDVVQLGGNYIIWLWALALPAGVALYLWNRHRVEDVDSRAHAALLPVSYAALLGVIGLLVFGRTFTAQWYFLPALFLVAAALEINFSREVRARAPMRLLYVGLTVVLCLVQVPSASEVLQYRQTKMDLIARQVAAQATAQDFVIVGNPLQGVSFNLYYQGAAPWETIPPLQDHRIHRFDLFRDQINNPGALQPLYQKIETTLRGGHRVFLVGEVKTHDVRNDPRRVVDLDATLLRWHTQLALFLGEHAGGAAYQEVKTDQTVFPLEAPDLIVVQGWR